MSPKLKKSMENPQLLCWVFFHVCSRLPTSFKFNLFSKNSFRNIFRVSDGMDPDLVPNCFQRLSAGTKAADRKERVNSLIWVKVFRIIPEFP